MAIKIGSNIPALQAQRRLSDASNATASVFEKLSSGLRINRASDDAAGLAIADDLNSKSRVYTRAMLNASEGLSVLSIADSTLSSLTEIVTRIRELSEQSANGTYSTDQRKALDTEAQALSKEYFRISRSASFNRINLFDGSLAEGLRLQVGYGTDGSLYSGIGGELGTGALSSGNNYTNFGTSSNAVALGDVNGDGILDMISGGANVVAGIFTIQLGDGSGSFGAATTYSNGTGVVTSLALGDLNGDGILDLVSGADNGATSSIRIQFGNGNGTFQAGITYTNTSAFGNEVRLGDINGDGHLDIVFSISADTRLGLMLGSASGTFAAATTINTSNVINDLQLVDFNNDGILDLLTAGDGGGRNLGYVQVALGAGNGTFATGVSYQTSTNSNYTLQVGDLNGDGIMDIVAAGGSGVGAGISSVLLGTGSGKLDTATTYATESTQTNALLLGDLNGDGVLDMITGGNSGDGYLTVRLGQGNGTFGTATSYASNTTNTYALAKGDINGDGVLDIVSAGANDGSIATSYTFLGATRDGISPLLEFSLRTKADSLQAMGMLDKTLSNLSQQRGVVGAFQSRIKVAASTLQSSRDNFKAAESRIRDVDIASTSAELVRTQILQQGATSILAQANQLPQLAIQLISNSAT